MQQTSDIRVRELVPLVSPSSMKQALPLTETAASTVVTGRDAVQRILTGKDRRLLAVVGPCSIHDPDAALEYAERLLAIRDEVADRLLLVMRVYFEKPRTTVGWKGLIYDPRLDGSEDLPAGLQLARHLLMRINDMGMPVGTEMLDTITPQYTSDLITWASIGARTTESQTHREMASGLSMPVGFKNSTDGNLQVALDAMKSACHPHTFLGIDQHGRTCMVRTNGNPYGHLVLRGGSDGPNYYPESIEAATARLRAAELSPRLLVDCSHANSGKQHQRQARVVQAVVQQKAAGEDAIIGVMLESNLNEGRQDIPADPDLLRYGVSVTDGCIGWDETARLLRAGRDGLGGR